MMPSGRPSSTKALWGELDALELYETWFVTPERLPDVKHKSLSKMYNRRAPRYLVRSLLVDGGVLFIAVGQESRTARQVIT